MLFLKKLYPTYNALAVAGKSLDPLTAVLLGMLFLDLLCAAFVICTHELACAVTSIVFASCRDCRQEAIARRGLGYEVALTFVDPARSYSSSQQAGEVRLIGDHCVPIKPC